MTVKEFIARYSTTPLIMLDREDLNERINNTEGAEYIGIKYLRGSINNLFECEDVTIEQKIRALDNYDYVIKLIVKELNGDISYMADRLDELRKELEKEKADKKEINASSLYYVHIDNSTKQIIISRYKDCPELKDFDTDVEMICNSFNIVMDLIGSIILKDYSVIKVI